MICDRVTGESRGFAFVSFEEVGGVASATACLEKTKARERHVTIDHAQQSSSLPSSQQYLCDRWFSTPRPTSPPRPCLSVLIPRYVPGEDLYPATN
eukprot:COSAG01_NODE_9800_length_2340_cov_5.178046_4_plen_96_part_00